MRESVRRGVSLVVLVCACASSDDDEGCGPQTQLCLFGACSDTDEGDTEVLEDPPLEVSDGCGENVSAQAIADTIAAVEDFAVQLEGFDACARIHLEGARTLVEEVVDESLSGSVDVTPPGWGYGAGGRHGEPCELTDVAATFTLAHDMELGPAGSVVVPDVFVLDSYIVDGQPGPDSELGVPQIEFASAGPLSELLGLGPNPVSPTEYIAGEGTKSFLAGRLRMEADSRLLRAQPQTLREILVYEEVPVEWVLPSMVRLGPELTFVVEQDTLRSRSAWDSQSRTSTHLGLQGIVTLAVSDGPFDFVARINVAPGQTNVELSCLGD